MPTLDWIGKDKIVNHHKDVPYCVLDRKYSFDSKGQHDDDNGSENMIIHGDNLYALKALLPKYEGKIKCIYIDPPYNTGNEGWVYDDNVNDPQIKKWLGEVVGKEGEDMTRHDKWLCMMYPRLKLLQKLLSNDGSIFISIDDNELYELKEICDEIFSPTNFICNFVWKSKLGKVGTTSNISNVHEYILCYAKCNNQLKFKKIETPNDGRIESLRQWGQEDRREDRPSMYYPIVIDGDTIYPIRPDGTDGRWRVNESKSKELLAAGLLSKHLDDHGNLNVYRQFPPGTSITTYSTLLLDEIGTTSKGAKTLKNIDLSDKFDYSKPTELIEYFSNLCMIGSNDIVLDSFAGSGTTGHAIMNYNVSHKTDAKYILIEMMPYAEEITSERIKRVISGYNSEPCKSSFSYYELGEPLMIDNCLNEHIDTEKIREYVFYTETKTTYIKDQSKYKYYLGEKNKTAYYFCYEKDRTVSLDDSLLSNIEPGFDNYVIYADVCYIPENFLKEHNIVFKKIPRDIGRF